MRSPIVSVLGHVDHGKTSILDCIRRSSVTSGESGGITQSIGASIVPIESIKKNSENLLSLTKTKLDIPGLLFIDTPGHAAFSSMRSRGGNLADIAVLVVDINEGFKPQTIEAVEILKSFKTPFIIAANKLDLVPGYRKVDDLLLSDLGKQSSNVRESVDTKLYELVGKIHEKFSLNADRFDRVDDYTKKIAIIPCSAVQNLGVSELLIIVSGMAQKFLEDSLKIDVKGFAKGTVLEVKEEKGLGNSLNSIIYDGTLKVNDCIVFAGIEKAIVTKVRALFLPQELSEMRDKKTKFKSVKEVHAAAGVKIVCPLQEQVLSGMAFETCNKESINEVSNKLQEQVSDIFINTDSDGIIAKADSIGGLEALVKLLKEHNIKIRKASIRNITKKDIIDAESSKNSFLRVVLGFNVSLDGTPEKAKIITSDIIYRLIEDYEAWIKDVKKELEEKEVDKLVRPAKLEILQNCIFRQSNPCIFGVEVLSGKIKSGIPVMNKNGDRLSVIKSINIENKAVSYAEKGKQVAISCPGITAGRQINEQDILYSSISESDFRELKRLKEYLSNDEISILKEIVEIKRRKNPVWGI